jgi:phosphatidate cytidylyltransferase
MSNFWQRTFTGIVFVLLLVTSIVVHPLVFGLLFLIVIVLGMLEFQKIVSENSIDLHTVSTLVLGAAIYVLMFFQCYLALNPKWLYLLIPFVISIFVIEMFRQKERPFLNIALSLFSSIYVVLPFVFLLELGFIRSRDYHYIIPLLFFCMIWMNDTGAYLVGVTFGKRKLFPRISPKKSWEGFYGGIFFSVLFAIIVSLNIDMLTTVDLLIMAIIVSVFGTLGDLTESMLKRSMNIKDSGTIMPGHGGILDRFDALTFAAPLVYLYFEIFK